VVVVRNIKNAADDNIQMKLISVGQAGADRAALDASIEQGIEYGGSIPKGSLAEDKLIDTVIGSGRRH
jgi:hypothetical protein